MEARWPGSVQQYLEAGDPDMNKQQHYLMTGIILGGLGVVLGAFGAHALKPALEANGRPEVYELAVRYQFYHALALLAMGLIPVRHPGRLIWGARSLLAGVIFFSGSLYVLALSGQTYWGAVTPIGGVMLILGWALCGASLLPSKRS